MQESHLHEPDYGDLDSVGVFQQRPSEGWGRPASCIDPVYASTKFFQALARVPGYQRLPVYRAAQAVQHSADGYAYEPVPAEATHLATDFTGRAAHAVWCWPPGATRHGPARPRPAGHRPARSARCPRSRSASTGDAPSCWSRPRRPAWAGRSPPGW